MVQQNLDFSEKTKNGDRTHQEELSSKLKHNEWKEYRLEEIATINPKTGKIPEKFCYIDLESVQSGLLKTKNIINSDDAPSRAQRVLKSNDILYQTVRPYQKNNLFFDFDDMDYVASTGYAQLRNNELCTPEFLYYLLHTDKFVNHVIAHCTGTSYPAINSNDLKKIKVKVPELVIQKKIENILICIDKKIELLEKEYHLLNEHKKGFIQKLRNGEIKFNNLSVDYPKWEEITLKDVLYEHKLKSTGKEEVCSVSVHKGVVNQIEHLGRSYATEDLSKYKLVKPGDIVYTKSPTAGFELGIIKQNKNNKNVLVSPLYGVFSPSNIYLGNYLDAYFESSVNTRNYLHPIVQKGAKNTMNITNKVFLSRSLLLPTDYEEQKKISNYIDLINKKCDEIFNLCENMKKLKKGLLQKMFV